MSSLSPSSSLDDGDSEEMEEVSCAMERCNLYDDNGDDRMAVDHDACDAEDDYSDFPNILIVTGVPLSVYDNQMYRDEFESLFQMFEPTPEFFYLKCFRRVRVIYQSSKSAIRTRIEMHEKNFHGSHIRCYFAQTPEMIDTLSSSSTFLLPPEPDKQFLISPPSSPPVGWEPITEKEPIINYDLISALTNLAPGEAHEIHASSGRFPSIVVHVCEDPEGFRNRPHLIQTRCPVRM